MNRSVFRDALSKGDQDTCLKSLESALDGGNSLVQYLNDLLFTATCIEWRRLPCDHPLIVLNSLKNIIGEDRDSPSKTLLNFGLELLTDQSLRKNDALILEEATRSGVGLTIFVGDLEDALQDGKWNESKQFAAKTFLASDRSRSVIDTLAAMALQNTERNGTFVFHLLRSFHFQEFKEDIWTYACGLLSIIEQQRLPEPHKHITIDPEKLFEAILMSDESDLWVTYSSVYRLWNGEYVRLKNYHREISNWLSGLVLDGYNSSEIYQESLLQKEENGSDTRFIDLAESIILQDKPALERGREIVILESLRGLYCMNSNDSNSRLIGNRLKQQFEL